MPGLKKNFCARCCVAFELKLRQDILLVLMMIGVVVGFIVGVAINGYVNAVENPEERKTMLILIGFPGELFINMLKMLVLPLIVASLVCALAGIDARASGRIGRRAIIYYLCTTVSAVIIGIAVVTIIKPGSRAKPSEDSEVSPYRPLDAFLDLLRSCFPDNIVEAAFSQKRTKYDEVIYDNSKTKHGGEPYNVTVDVKRLNASQLAAMKIFNNGTHNLTTVHKAPSGDLPTVLVPAGLMVDPKGTLNVVGLVVFSMVFGIFLGNLRERGAVMKSFFDALNEIVMKMIKLVMWISPIGICSLIAAKIAAVDNILESFRLLGMYTLTVICGLGIHLLIVLPLIYFIVMHANPFKFMMRMSGAIITMIGTASSAATLPTTMRCLEENNKVDMRISRFILPLGAVLNMDGTALYEAVSALFIAQASGIKLTIPEIIITSLTSTAVSIGAAGIPQAGLVTMVIVLQAVGLPTDYIALLFSVDVLLDRLRGIVNIMGDSYGAAIVEHLSRNDLLQLEFESRDPMSEQLVDLGTRFTPKCDVYGRVTVQARDDENANERLMDKERSFDENLDDDKPRLTETTF